MSEKFLPVLVTAAVIAPVCAVCVAGPAVITSIFTGIAAWFGGFDLFLATGLVLVAGIAAYAIFRRQRAQRSPVIPGRKVGDER